MAGELAAAAGAMGGNGTLRISPEWSYTNSVNNKVLRVKFGGTTMSEATRTATASDAWIMHIANRNAPDWQVAHQMGTGASADPPYTLTFDTTAEATITLTCTKASAGETCTLERYMVELILP